MFSCVAFDWAIPGNLCKNAERRAAGRWELRVVASKEGWLYTLRKGSGVFIGIDKGAQLTGTTWFKVTIPHTSCLLMVGV